MQIEATCTNAAFHNSPWFPCEHETRTNVSQSRRNSRLAEALTSFNGDRKEIGDGLQPDSLAAQLVIMTMTRALSESNTSR